MEATNIKIHVKVISDYLDYYKILSTPFQSKNITKETKSFVVIRLKPEKPYVYTCFYTGHINITGIRKVRKINSSIKALRRHLQIKENIFTAPVIDNISSKWTDKLEKFNISKVHAIAKLEKSVQQTKYNRERFPGLFIKTEVDGTILWFASPAVVGVGSKTIVNLQNLKLLVESISAKCRIYPSVAMNT